MCIVVEIVSILGVPDRLSFSVEGVVGRHPQACHIHIYSNGYCLDQGQNTTVEAINGTSRGDLEYGGAFILCIVVAIERGYDLCKAI